MKTFSLSIFLLLSLDFCLCEPDLYNAAPLLPKAASQEGEVFQAQVPLEPSSQRKSKLFPYFLIQFPNGHCSTSAGSGVCVSAKDCRTSGGSLLGACAQGFGACCRYIKSCGKDGGDIQVKENSTQIQSMNGSSSCRFVLPKGRNICQLRLDFTEFEFGEGLPTGDCSDTKVVISGGRMEAMHLCGNLSGQHLYFNYGTAEKFFINAAEPATEKDKFSIRISYIGCNSRQSVPSHCTQMITDSEGTIRSLNWPQQQLNSQEYTVCISPPDSDRRKRSRLFSVSATSRRMEWSTCGNGPEDFLISGNRTGPPENDPSNCDYDYIQIFGGNRQCGNTFKNEIIHSPPYLLRVRFDGAESFQRSANQIMVVSKPGEGCESLSTKQTSCAEIGTELSRPSDEDEGRSRKKVCKCMKVTPNLKKSRADEGNTGFCLKYKIVE